MKLVLSLLILAFNFGAPQAKAQDITLAKVAELACHRVERLVTLKKIDESFLYNFQGLEVTPLQPKQPTDPAYKALVNLLPGADGSVSRLEIMMDIKGKALGHTVQEAQSAQNPPSWPDKDPVTITENALHYVLEGWQTDAKVKPFFTGFSSLILTQAKSRQGELLAKAEIFSHETASVLEVFVKPDGTFHSANLRSSESP